MAQPQPQPVPPAPGAPGVLHAVIHALQVFGIAFVAALALQPNKVSRDAVYAAIAAGIRAVFAYVHH